MRKILKYLKPYRGLIYISVILIAIHAFTVMYLAQLMAKMIQIGADAQQEIIYRALMMLLIAVISGAAMILGTYTSSLASSRLGQTLRNEIVKKTQTYGLYDMEKFGTASLIARTTNDVSIIQTNFMMIMQMLLKAPLMTVFGLVLAFMANPMIAGIMTASLFVFVMVAILIGKRVIPLFDKIQVKYDNLTHTFREVITGVRVIRAFNKQTYEINRVHKAGTEFALLGIKINKKFALLIPLLIFMVNIAILGVISYGGMTAKNFNDLTATTAMVEYLTIIMFNVLMAMFVILEIPRAQASAKRILEVLNLSVNVDDTHSSYQSLHTNEVSLIFDHVSFQYADAQLPTLKDISFEAKEGQMIAIIGSTGSGKSTVSKLIDRFFDVTSGKIMINGINISKVKQEVLRTHVGYIPQKAFLFRGTIASNLRFGNKDASLDDLIEASTIAQAHNFIMTKEKGYEDYVAQGGSNLSGGQKQRIAIARALVQKPDIYVFDDSFSALDFKTDQALRKALKTNVKKAIMVVIAQRISTVMEADQIIVLKEGEMVGRGTHQDLLKTCSTYLEIALSQMSKAELFGDKK